jgi:N4-gp56 family major capsid protein
MTAFISTSANYADVIQASIQKSLEKALQHSLVHAVPGSFRELTHTSGLSFTVGSFAEIAANLTTNAATGAYIDETSPPTAQALVFTDETCVGKLVGKVLQTSELARYAGPFDLAVVMADSLSRWMGSVIDLTAQSALAGTTNIVYSNGTAVSTVANKFDTALLRRAVGIMREHNVLPLASTGMYRLVTSGRCVVDLAADTAGNNLSDVFKRYPAGQADLQAGVIGSYFGADIAETSIATTATTAGAAGADVVTSYLIGADALAIGDLSTIRTTWVAGPDHSDPLAQSVDAGVKAFIACMRLEAAGAFKVLAIKSAATALVAGQA